MITNHTQLIQALIDKYDLRSYLELGVQSTAQNFDKIKCDFKFGVDPDVIAPKIFTGTSDQYFANKDSFQAGLKFGICFIDGLHTKEQVKMDFENCLKCLAPNGFIVIHDVLPENEEGTKVPRVTKQWWGDVYKWAMQVYSNHPDVCFKTFNIDNGCMLLWKESRQAGPPHLYLENDGSPFNWWKHYKDYGPSYLNVTNEVII